MKNISRQRIRPHSGPHTLVLSLLVLLGAFGSFSHKAEADISLSPLPASTNASLISSGTNITICADTGSGTTILIGQTAPATYNDGSFEMRSGDGCNTINWTTTNHDSYGNTLVGSRAYYVGNYFNGSNNVTATIYVCGSGTELTMDSTLATGCGGTPPTPPPPITNPFYYTYASSTCNVIGSPPTQYICNATTTQSIYDRPITDNHFIIILGYLTAILTMWLIISLFKRKI